jgi:hypothetical protein
MRGKPHFADSGPWVEEREGTAEVEGVGDDEGGGCG